MDNCQLNVATFNKVADIYADKYFASAIYNKSYDFFCHHLKKQNAKILDMACGPGNVVHFLTQAKPDAEIIGIDLAPRMIELAKNLVPTAHFMIHDCRQMTALNQCFDGITFAFGLNYLSDEDVQLVFDALPKMLLNSGIFYLSASLGDKDKSGIYTSNSGNQMHVYYRNQQEIMQLIKSAGMDIIYSEFINSPPNAPIATTDLVLIASRTTSM